MTGIAVSRSVADLREAHARNVGAGACSAASRDRSRRRSPGIDLAVWDLYARRRETAAVETARRQRPARSRSTPAASIRPVRGRWRKRRWPWTPCTETQDWLRACEPIAPISHRFVTVVGSGMLAADANQAWSTAQALEIAPHLGGIRSRMAGGADPRRPALAGVADLARRSQPCRSPPGKISRAVHGFRQVLGGRRIAGGSARYREMGRANGVSASLCARHLEIRQDVLSALSRRRDRSTRIGASARRSRGRRPAGGRFQRQSSA